MDFLRHLIFLILPMLLLGGCYTDFDFDDRSDPVVCLNSDITAGDTIRVQVTRTWTLSEGNPYLSQEFYPDIKDADVSLYVNGTFVEKMRRGFYYQVYSITMYGFLLYGYVADYIPKSGDEICIVADTPLYGSARGEVTVPYPVEIDSVNTKVVGFSENIRTPDQSGLFDRQYSMVLDIYASFTDPASTTDYYKLDASWQPYIIMSDSEPSVSTPEENHNYPIAHISYGTQIDFSGEPLLTEHVSALESIFSDTSGYTVFSDRQISGRSYPLHIMIKKLDVSLSTPLDQPAYDDLNINVILSRVSPSYYRHVMSMWAANDGLSGGLGNFGLSDPVFPASNVSTGAGVIAAKAPYTFRINLRDIIREQLSAAPAY